VAALGADSWLVAAGAPGPFTTSTPIPAAEADRVAAMPGVARADPLVVLHSTVRRPTVRDVNVIGARPGGLGTPPLAGAAPWPGRARWWPTPGWGWPRATGWS
jgi:hypothetical protein